MSMEKTYLILQYCFWNLYAKKKHSKYQNFELFDLPSARLWEIGLVDQIFDPVRSVFRRGLIELQILPTLIFYRALRVALRLVREISNFFKNSKKCFDLRVADWDPSVSKYRNSGQTSNLKFLTYASRAASWLLPINFNRP